MADTMEKLTNFNELEYKRLDYDDIKESVNKLTKELEKATSFNDFLITFQKIIEIQNEIEEMCDYADIRNMRDTKNEYFDAEINYWNEFKSKFDSLFNRFYEITLSTPYKEQLKSFVPEVFFLNLEYQLKIRNESISELESYEKELEKQYRKLIQTKINYNGEEVNLSKIVSDLKNPNREIRKQAADAYNDHHYANKDEFDRILIELIKTRKNIASTLGFSSYKEYSLYKLKRFGYNYHDIKIFRDNIIEYIIPVLKKVKVWQKLELGLEELTYYDNILFKNIAEPLYKEKELLQAIGASLKDIDASLYELYINMLESNYIDLENRDNKVNFAITNYLCKSGLPVVTGNFKGTYYDVTTCTHEFGHSFQKYNASLKDKEYIISPLLKYPTMEIAEMFSHAMQIIVLPYLKDIFDEESYPKYCFQVLYDLVSLLPYICLVDEFQEKIYSLENITADNIHQIWLELAKKYKLEVQNKGHINLDTGGYFYRQNHIYLSPFYYIDYALSTIGALSIADSCCEDLETFKKVASVASYYPIKELSKKYNLPDPFDAENIKEISRKLEYKLESFYKEINQ